MSWLMYSSIEPSCKLRNSMNSPSLKKNLSSPYKVENWFWRGLPGSGMELLFGESQIGCESPEWGNSSLRRKIRSVLVCFVSDFPMTNCLCVWFVELLLSILVPPHTTVATYPCYGGVLLPAKNCFLRFRFFICDILSPWLTRQEKKNGTVQICRIPT